MRRSLAVVLLALAPGGALAQIGSETVGVNAHVPDTGMLDACDALGVEWIRIDVNWRDVHLGPGSFDFGAIDAVLAGASARSLSVFATLAYTPDWVPRVARTRTDAYGGNDQPASSAEWVAFVEEAVRHMRARGVRHFGIWNEANLDGFWEEEAGLDAWVDTIAVPGAAAVRRACGDCLVIGPELANVGEADVALDRIFTRAPPGTFDIVSHHIYQGWGGGTSDSFLNVLEDRRAPVTRASLREVLDLHGYDGEVWITETGYRADPGDAGDEETQRDYVTRVLDAQLERAWWTATFFYEIMDCGVDAPDCPIDGFGLVRPTRAGGGRAFPADFRRKPAFDAIASALSARPELLGEGPARECGNGLDDDGDGRVDLADRGCAGQADGDEGDDPLRRTVNALRMASAPAIDGSIDEWSDEDWVALTLADDWVASRIGPPGPATPRDLDVRVAARWAPGWLVIAIAVEDDTHAPSTAGDRDRPWEADSAQLAIDPLATGGYAYDADDHEWTFWWSGATSVLRSAGARDPVVEVGRAARTTVYEIGLPADMLGAPLEPGALVRASLLVNERDDDAREGWVELTPGIGRRKAPELFGVIAVSGRMQRAPGARDAGTAIDAGGEPAPPGGCACRAGASARASVLPWLVLALLLTLRRRAGFFRGAHGSCQTPPGVRRCGEEETWPEDSKASRARY